MEQWYESLVDIRDYLELRDIRLMASDGPCRDSLEGCEKALRIVWLLVNEGLEGLTLEEKEELKCLQRISF